MRTFPALLLLLFLIPSCSSTSPTQQEDPIPYQDRPFYYYQHEPVYLDVDPSRLIVATDLPMPEAVRSALAPLGVVVDSAGSLPLVVVPGHWIVYLHPGTSRDLAVQGGRHLRLAHGFSFASNAYLLDPPGTSLMLINEFIVRLQPGRTIADIASAGGITGANVVRRTEWDSLTYVLSFPAGSRHTPLEICAFYDQQAGVDYTTPGFLFRIERLSGNRAPVIGAGMPPSVAVAGWRSWGP